MMNLEETRTLAEFIEKAATAYGERTALRYRPKFRSLNFTYQETYQLAQKVAQMMKTNGIEKGDRVIIWANNSPFWVAGFFGIQLLGGVAVPLNVGSRGEFIKKIAEATKASFLLKSAHLTLPDPLNLKSFDLETLQLSAKVNLPDARLDENDLAEIVYTSGTTGFPKGVMLTHKNILSNLQGALSVINLTREDRGLSILPLSHMFEQVAGMLAPLASGTQVTYAVALNSINIRKNLVEDKITKMAAVPEFLRLILRRLEEKAADEGKGRVLDLLFELGEKTPFMSVRRILFRSILKRFGGKLDTIISGGSALDPEVGKKWEAMGIYILQGYGTTEASPVISANSYKNRKIDSVGPPLAGVEVKIASDGEILARGDNIFMGYYEDPEKTKEAFEGEWYKTGDLGYLDKAGHLYIHGRKKYTIITEAGENVYPEDLEFELNKFPKVVDSCVVAIPHREKEIIHAVLLGGEIPHPDSIITKTNQKLASFQQIQDFSIWPFDDFPRTVTKKVKRDEVVKYLLTKKIEKEELIPASAGFVERSIAKITGKPTSGISPEKKLVEDLKMDSLDRVELVALIEEETGVIIDESEIGPGTTVSDIKEKVEKNKQKTERYEFKEWPLAATILSLRKLIQRLFLFSLASYFVKIEVNGEENLEKLTLPALFYSNHLSAVDPVVLVKSLPSKIRERLAIAAASDVIYEQPNHQKYEGLLTFGFNIFPFSRSGQIKSSLEYTGRLLDRGFSVLAFPEGRVSTDGKMQVLKEGAGFLAVEMSTAVVPIKIEGTQQVVAPGTELPCWPKKGKITIKFGKPLQFPSTASYIEATKVIEDALQKL
jgi:long-chain acyl-CoA synthetase